MIANWAYLLPHNYVEPRAMVIMYNDIEHIVLPMNIYFNGQWILNTFDLRSQCDKSFILSEIQSWRGVK